MSERLILIPGQDPPAITPFCQLCDQPVENYCMDVNRVGLEDVIGIHAQCCNRTSSTRIGLKVYLEAMSTGAKLYVIVRKGSQAGLRVMKSRLRSISH